MENVNTKLEGNISENLCLKSVFSPAADTFGMIFSIRLHLTEFHVHEHQITLWVLSGIISLPWNPHRTSCSLISSHLNQTFILVSCWMIGRSSPTRGQNHLRPPTAVSEDVQDAKHYRWQQRRHQTWSDHDARIVLEHPAALDSRVMCRRSEPLRRNLPEEVNINGCPQPIGSQWCWRYCGLLMLHSWQLLFNPLTYR